MKNVNPIIFITAFLLLFLFGDLLLIYFLIKINKISVIGVILLSCLALLLSYIAYSLNFGISVSPKQLGILKDQLSYSDQGFILHHSLLEYNEIVPWESIEAIFLSNRPPLDGEYHNFEYSIFLNCEPQVLKYEIQSWLNRSSIFPKPKRRGLPILTIKDDDNRDFHTLNDAINKYLSDIHKDSEKYLKLKFGNEMHLEKSGNTIKGRLYEPIRSFGFYKIFDRNNPLADDTLRRFRQEAQNA